MIFTYKTPDNHRNWIDPCGEPTKYEITLGSAITLRHREYGTDKWYTMTYPSGGYFYVCNKHYLLKEGTVWSLEYIRK